MLMAQMGSFVPARSARIGLVDRIFTTRGSHGQHRAGPVHVMVEMKETAHILEKATERSLILLDEIGRGTSTFDGVSIAWAVAELRGAEDLCTDSVCHALPRARGAEQHLSPTYRTGMWAVKEWGENILFLRKVQDGSSSHSYGIQVARLAGVPRRVIDRATEILENLETGQWDDAGKPRLAVPHDRSGSGEDRSSPELFPEMHSLHDEILALNLMEMTPLEAMNRLQEIQERLGGRKGGARGRG